VDVLLPAALGALVVACAALLAGRAGPRLSAPFARLPAPDQRTPPWLGALLGYALGGVGVALAFRKVPDLVAGIVLLLPLGLASSEESGLAWWYWLFAALAGLYSLLRAETGNRRLDAEAARPPDT
jgi:hypothetical protein